MIAVTIVSEVCDFARFPSASSFMAFTGLVPSGHSSGMSSRRGAITKTGNLHVRRVLVEAESASRHRPAVGCCFAAEARISPPSFRAFFWRARLRLYTRYRGLAPVKGSRKAVVAVAMELSGCVRAVMNDRID